jgi:Helix-turn-helix domain
MANYSVSGSIIAKLKLRTSYLNTTEVMEILRRSRKTLCAWVKAGDILAVRVGRDNMFDPWELALWLEDGQLGRRAHDSGKQDQIPKRPRVAMVATA